MHLTNYTDYSLRTLMYLKLHPYKRVTVAEIADYFEISHNHVVKVANNLAKMELIEATRGKGGGIKLLPAAETQPLGELVKVLEPKKDLVSCINKDGKLCNIAAECSLTGVLDDALGKFFDELNRYKLDDVVKCRNEEISVNIAEK